MSTQVCVDYLEPQTTQASLQVHKQTNPKNNEQNG